MSKLVKRFWSDESGASATEYAVLVFFIAVAVSFAVPQFKTALSTLFVNLGTKIEALLT